MPIPQNEGFNPSDYANRQPMMIQYEGINKFIIFSKVFEQWKCKFTIKMEDFVSEIASMSFTMISPWFEVWKCK